MSNFTNNVSLLKKYREMFADYNFIVTFAPHIETTL